MESFKSFSLPIGNIYQYSYKQFGTTFSRFSDRLKETVQKRHERLKKKELKEEINTAEKVLIKTPLENFKNENERQKYYLKKSAGESPSDDEGEFTID
jgi:hypothetical protein